MINELVDILENLLHLKSLQSFNQKSAITTKEKQRPTSASTIALRKFKSLFVRSIERFLDVVKRQLIIL